MRSTDFSVAVYSPLPWGHACTFLRAEGPIQQAGLSLIPGSEWHDQTLDRYLPNKSEDADLVLVQREFPGYTEAYQEVVAHAQRKKRPIVYDWDDLLLEVPLDIGCGTHFRSKRAQIVNALVEADAVTTSSVRLAEVSRFYNPNVVLLPNCLDERLWRLRDNSWPSGERKRVIIGYMGGRLHGPDVSMIEPVLRHLVHRYQRDLMIKFWGGSPPPTLLELEGVEWIPLQLNYADFAARFLQQDSDIFIAPLRNDYFNLFKSPIKFLEYSALGVAGVYSRIPPYEDIVVHGANGFLAQGLEEWEYYLIRLIEDPSLRRHMGRQAQDTVRAHWLLSAHASRWAEAYQMICSRTRARQSA